MAITNSPNIFKDIVVKNSTPIDLSNLYFAYAGVDRPVLKINHLPRGQQLKKSILISYLKTPTNLVLVSDSESGKKEIIAYDKLNKNDLSPLTLTITQDSGILKVIASQE